ncbi:MAG: hypothetical protein AAGI50_13915 [Pseudomonadota bacterium]
MTDQPEAYCCEAMKRDLTGTCDQHTREECPDFLFSYDAPFDEYSLIVRGVPWSVTIRYCPFCGAKFPESQRDAWFDTLEAMGFEPPLHDAPIPEAFRTSAWRKAAP